MMASAPDQKFAGSTPEPGSASSMTKRCRDSATLRPPIWTRAVMALLLRGWVANPSTVDQ